MLVQFALPESTDKPGKGQKRPEDQPYGNRIHRINKRNPPARKKPRIPVRPAPRGKFSVIGQRQKQSKRNRDRRRGEKPAPTEGTPRGVRRFPGFCGFRKTPDFRSLRGFPRPGNSRCLRRLHTARDFDVFSRQHGPRVFCAAYDFHVFCVLHFSGGRHLTRRFRNFRGCSGHPGSPGFAACRRLFHRIPPSLCRWIRPSGTHSRTRFHLLLPAGNCRRCPRCRQSALYEQRIARFGHRQSCSPRESAAPVYPNVI